MLTWRHPLLPPPPQFSFFVLEFYRLKNLKKFFKPKILNKKQNWGGGGLV